MDCLCRTDPTRTHARTVLRERLHGTRMHAVILDDASFIYYPESLRKQAALHYASAASDTDGSVRLQNCVIAQALMSVSVATPRCPECACMEHVCNPSRSHTTSVRDDADDS